MIAPRPGKKPVSGFSGHSINHLRSFSRLIRKHHVLGSATFLSSGNDHALIFTSSSHPLHTANTETYFRVASITKIATAVLVMHLADRSVLAPDVPVADFFPGHDLNSMLDGITLMHLLSHTSGLVDPPGLEESLEKGIPFTQYFPAVRRFPPGHSFHYSNLGFGIIGCVLESVLNRSVGEIYRHYLFEPLHMNATLEGCLLPENMIMPVTRILPWKKGHDLVCTVLGSNPLHTPDPLRHYGHTAGSMYTDILSLEKLRNDAEVAAMITAGSTGCALVGSCFHLGLSKGLLQPALASALPTQNGKWVILCDCGSNLNPKAKDLGD